MILNTHTNQSLYIGAAADVAQRFAGRLAVCRELGFAQTEVTHIRVFTIEVNTQVYGLSQMVPTPPDDNGRTSGPQPVDAEHVLIRTCTQLFHWPVRNSAKMNEYRNYRAVSSTLMWMLVDEAAMRLASPSHRWAASEWCTAPG